VKRAIWPRMADMERTSLFSGSLTSRRDAALDSGMGEKGETRMHFRHLRSAKRYASHPLALQCVTCPWQRVSALEIQRCGTTTRSTSNATPSHTADAWAMPIGSKAEKIANKPAYRQQVFRSVSNHLTKDPVEEMNQGGTMMTNWGDAETLPMEDARGTRIGSCLKNLVKILVDMRPS